MSKLNEIAGGETMYIMLSDNTRISVSQGWPRQMLSILVEERRDWGPEPSRKERMEMAKRSASKDYVPKGGWNRWKPEPWPLGSYWTPKQSIELSNEAASHLGQMLLDRAATDAAVGRGG